MENEIKTTSTEVKSFQTLPEAYQRKKTKGKPYAFYAYSHYEVYHGDLFYTQDYLGRLIFARAITKGRFEPFGLFDILNGTQTLPFDDVIDMTLKSLPCEGSKPLEEENTAEVLRLELFKQYLPARYSVVLSERENTDFVTEYKKHCFHDENIKLNLGLFRRGSIEGKPFTLPEKLLNEPHVVLNGLEKELMEPYFEVDAPYVFQKEGERTPAHQGAEKLLFRRILSMTDFFNLLEEGKAELLLEVSSLRARISHPYHYIPAEWVNGTYECSRGTKYDINTTFWYFADQFIHNIGLSIVNLKEQMMPYYQKNRDTEIPKDLRREDVMYLASKWFVQDIRDGRYYFLQPAIINDDGSYFCLDKKWFSLFHDRVRHYGKKTVCDIDEFKFRSSKDKRYFQLFCLEQEDLAYAFEMAIDMPNFEDFYWQMNRHFNPGAKKKGNIENVTPVQLTQEQKKRIEKVIDKYLENHMKEDK